MRRALPLALLLLALGVGAAGRDARAAAGGEGAGEPIRELWQRDAGRSIVLEPLLFRDRVVVVTTDRKVRCFERETGRQVWMRSFKNPILSRPCFAEECGAAGGVVLYLGAERGKLQGLDAATGRVLWSQERARSVAQIESRDSLLWILERRGRLEARRIAGESPNWQAWLGGWDSPGFLLDGDRLFLLARRDSLYALDAASGRRLWTSLPEGRFAAPPRRIGADLVVLSLEGSMSRIDPESGAIREREQRAPGQLTAPVACGGGLLTASSSGLVEGGGRGTGVPPWRADLDEAIAVPAVSLADRALVATDRGRILSIGPGGDLRQWSLSPEGGLGCSPLITEDGILVVGGKGDVYVYRR